MTWFFRSMAVLALVALAACDVPAPNSSVGSPAPRPAAVPAPGPAGMSAESAALRRYYAQVLQDGLTRGLLRTDGGGPDTPYTSDMLLRNFERIAFFNEYSRGRVPLRRWASPVRIEARFGASVPQSQRNKDGSALRNFANRLSRVTGHPVSMSASPNFHVFFVSEDDRPTALQQIRQIEPGIDAGTLRVISDIPRSTYCLVVAFTSVDAPSTYTRAIAIIRTEQPDLMRLSCIHEEVAQGLGLANDFPQARPSIFNDDDEFALLTSHDEKLLAMLYDRRVRIGMSADTARPILRQIAREQTGDSGV